MGTTGIAGLIASLLVGGAVGTAAFVGVINSQTGAPSKSPASVANAEEEIPYGVTG